MVGSRGAHLEPEYTGKLDKICLGLITDPRSMKKHDHDDDDGDGDDGDGDGDGDGGDDDDDDADDADGDGDADADGDGRDEQCCKVPCFSLSGDSSIKDTPHLNMFLTEPKKNCPKNWMVQHSKIRHCVSVSSVS